MALCLSGQEDLWLTKVVCKSVICPNDITASASKLGFSNFAEFPFVLSCLLSYSQGERGQLREEEEGEKGGRITVDYNKDLGRT